MQAFQISYLPELFILDNAEVVRDTTFVTVVVVTKLLSGIDST